MQLAYKHENQKALTLPDFSGGLNILVSPESLQNNELQRVVNFEIDNNSGTLQVSPGIVSVYNPNLVLDTIYINGSRKLFSVGNKLYSTTFSSHTLLGTLTGSKRPMYALFGPDVLIASGGKLQKFDGTTLTTIDASPECEIVFIRAGRAVVAKSGEDYLRYSGTGDATNWTFDANAGNAKYIEVGYKDAGDIVAIVPLTQELIVFKSNNKVFRISNEYPNWQVNEISRNAHCINSWSVVQAGNDIFFLGNFGFLGLSTVVDYGAVKSRDVGAKINSLLIRQINDSARLWYLPTKKQIWICPQNSKTVYIYHLLYDSFTTREFPVPVTDVVTDNNDIYLSRGTKILRIEDQNSLDDGNVIYARLTTKKFIGTGRWIIKKVSIDAFCRFTGEVTANVENLGLSLSSFGVTETKVVFDNDKACLDNDPLSIESYKSITKSTNYTTKTFEIDFTVKSGCWSIRKIEIVAAEV